MADLADKRTDLLAHLRVVEVATFIFAPAAATIMSDFGAEIIKVELPGMGDAYRHLYRLPPLPASEQNYCWLLESRNKKSVALDLKHAAGRDILLKLVETADVFITNYQPSVLAALQLSEPDLRPLNERMIYAHVTGYGEAGDDVEQPGFDMTAYWSRSGLMEAVTARDCEPGLSVAGLGDHPSSCAMFGAIMLALYRRERTGLGTKVSSSLMANGAWANSCMLQAALCGATFYPKNSRAAPFNPLVNHYVSRDGKRFLLCCLKAEHDWPHLCQAVELPCMGSDPNLSTVAGRQQHSAEIVARLDAQFAKRDLAEWRTIFADHHLVWSPVALSTEVIHDPQLRASEVLVPFDDPELSHMLTINSPFFLAGEPKRRPLPPPAIGQHTREVLQSIDYSDTAIDALAAERVIQL